MNSTNLALEVFSEPSPKQKTVRISKIVEVRDLSPESKEDNLRNNFTKKERNESLNSIFEDQEFKQYLEIRSKKNHINNKGNNNKDYRSRIISLWQKREELLSEICNRNTPTCPKPNCLFFFNHSTPFTSYYSEKYYYKSFLYPI